MKRPNFFRQVKQDGARFKNANGPDGAIVNQSWNFRIRIEVDKSRSELVAFVNIYSPGIIVCLADTGSQQLLWKDRKLDAVRRPLRVDLERGAVRNCL